jgi:hypothetical protein
VSDDCDSSAARPAKHHLLEQQAEALQQFLQQQNYPQQLQQQQQQQPSQQQRPPQQQQQQQVSDYRPSIDSAQCDGRSGLDRNLETVCEACAGAEEGTDSFRGSNHHLQQQQQQQQQQQDRLQKLTTHALQRHHYQQNTPHQQQQQQQQQQQRQQTWTAEPGTLIYKSSSAKTCSEDFTSSSSPSSKALKALASTPSHNLNTASFDRWLEATSIRIGGSASKPRSSSSSSRRPRSPKHARSIAAASGGLSAVSSRTAAGAAAAAAVRSNSPTRGHISAGSPTRRKAHQGFGSVGCDSLAAASLDATHEPCVDLGKRVDSTQQLARQQNDYRKFLLKSLGSITD